MRNIAKLHSHSSFTRAHLNARSMRKAGGMLWVSGISSRRPDNTHVGAEKQPDGVCARVCVHMHARKTIDQRMRD